MREAAADARVVARAEHDRLRRRRPAVDYRPMKATSKELDELRGVLSWVRSSKAPASAELREQHLAEALERAIDMLSRPDPRTTTLGWVLAALYQSVRRSPHGGNNWFVVDRDVYSWAMEQVEKLTGNHDASN